MNRQTAIKENLKLRARTIQAIRNFFIGNDYLEVETPFRIPAPAPEAHIDAQAAGSWFLHTSPELCMKRLLSSGYTRIFQICKCYRTKERGNRHLPEFTLLEWYNAKNDYVDLMDQCEDLVIYAARENNFEDVIRYQGAEIDLKKPWEKLTVTEAFNRYSPISMEKALAEDKFDEMIACEIEPHLGLRKPLFLYDYPASKAALAKLKDNNHMLAQRFELYIGGLELSNAFTELTDASEQRKRFEEELQSRHLSGNTVYPMPEPFLKSLKTMPDAAGIAFGIDRLVMLFADTPKIDDVVTFTPEEL